MPARILTASVVLPRISPALCLWMALLFAAALAVHCGAVSIRWHDWLAILPGDGMHAGNTYVLWQLRLPRILFAMLIGASLGGCGALTQALFRNPLADPALLGVSSGAACAAALSIVLLANLQWSFAWRFWLLPAMAFGGALFVCLLLDRIARWLLPGSISGLLMSGIACNALAAACVGLCTYLATDEQLRSLTFWTLGSLAAANWWLVGMLAVLLIVTCAFIVRYLPALNALALGEAAATHVGIDVHRLRIAVIIVVALLCGFAVAWCGMIGFIGLVAPHIVRSWVGADQRIAAPLAMLMGALLMLLADTAARTLAIPAEIPVGIFTSLLGAPFFLFQLARASGRMA